VVVDSGIADGVADVEETSSRVSEILMMRRKALAIRSLSVTTTLELHDLVQRAKNHAIRQEMPTIHILPLCGWNITQPRPATAFVWWPHATREQGQGWSVQFRVEERCGQALFDKPRSDSMLAIRINRPA
jgi:hypothetical protein